MVAVPKPAIRDYTRHPVSVVVWLVSVRRRTISVSTDNDSAALSCTVTKPREWDERLLLMSISSD